MNRNIAFPFLILDDLAVKAEQWLVGLDNGDMIPAGELLADWDYSSTLNLKREVLIDRNLAARQLGISNENLVMEVCLQVGSGSGRLPRFIHRHDRFLVPVNDTTVKMDVLLEGNSISSILDLSTTVFLAAVPPDHETFSPKI